MCAVVLSALGWLLSSRASAQELEPRSYSPAPVGMNFWALSYLHTSGEVTVDPTLPIDNVHASLDSATAAYAHTFSMFGRSASIGFGVPYIEGDVSGDVQEESRQVSRAGFGDARARLAVNLLGAPAMTPAAFAQRTARTTLGASLTVIAPSGEYRSAQLVNLGSNRWAFKPELGVYRPLGPWSLELSTGVWLFTANDQFFGGVRREQDPLTSVQAHASYTFRPGLWLAAGMTWYGGGDTSIDGARKHDRQSNSRAGMTLSVPVARGHSLKLSYSEGVTARIGSNFEIISLTYQYARFGSQAR